MHINLPDKLYYKIGEISKAFKVNSSLLRFWEREFNGLHPKKDKNGKRIYTKKDVELIKQIYFLVKEKGYTLEGAKSKLKEKSLEETEMSITKNNTVINRLEKIKSELILIKEFLD